MSTRINRSVKELRGGAITSTDEVRKQILLSWGGSLRSKSGEKHFTHNTEVLTTSSQGQTMQTGFEEFNEHHRTSE